LKSTTDTTTPDRLAIFVSALLRSLLSQSSISSFPETFQLDTERLRSIRHDLQHIIHLDTCCDVFDMLVGQSVSKQVRARASGALRSSLVDIVGASRRFADSAGNIAVEIVRLALQVEGSLNDTDADLVELAEQRLRVELPVSSLAFTSRAKLMFEEKLPSFFAMVKANVRLTAMALHEAMLPSLTPIQQPWAALQTTNASLSKREARSIDDVLRRMTHVAVLHWHVWSPIVYNLPDEEEATPSSPVEAAELSCFCASERGLSVATDAVVDLAADRAAKSLFIGEVETEIETEDSGSESDESTSPSSTTDSSPTADDDAEMVILSIAEIDGETVMETEIAEFE